MLPYAAFSKSKVMPKDAPHRVYGVLGDGYLQNQVTRQIIAWSLGEDGEAEFNLDTLEGEGATVSDVFSRCGQLPFLCDRRVVLVQRAERLENMHRGGEDGESGSKSKSGKDSPAKRLLAGMEKLPETTVLILARTPETPEIGTKKEARCFNANIDKAIEGKDIGGLLIDCTVSQKSASTAIAILNNEAASRDIPLGAGVCEFLVARAGTDIAALINALEKCALRVGVGNIVTKPIVEEMVRRQPQDTVFSLTDAIGRRETARAMALLHELVSEGNAPEMILSLVARHLRQLMQMRALLDARVPISAAASTRMAPELVASFPSGKESILPTLGNSWRSGPLQQQARNFTVAQLQAALCAALETDLAIKGIEGDGGAESNKHSLLALELFIARLC